MEPRHYFLCFLMIIAGPTYAQWSQTGDNYTTGKVGIGTNTPTVRLDVRGLIRIDRANAVDNNSPGIVYLPYDDFLYDGEYLNHYGFGFHSYQDGSSSVTNPPNVYMSGYFGIDLFSGGLNRLRISRHGSVGIGTVSPEGKLDVSSSFYTGPGAIVVRPQNDTWEGGEVVLKGAGGYNQWALDNFQGALRLHHSGGEHFVVTANGNIGIGTNAPDAKLAVKGIIHTQEVKVDIAGSVAPDFVFEKNYLLPGLKETEVYIQDHKHLPGIPSGQAMEEHGINLKEMNLKLLQKVEELTLYVIEQQKQLEAQQLQINFLIKGTQNSENR